MLVITTHKTLNFRINLYVLNCLNICLNSCTTPTCVHVRKFRNFSLVRLVFKNDILKSIMKLCIKHEKIRVIILHNVRQIQISFVVVRMIVIRTQFSGNSISRCRIKVKQSRRVLQYVITDNCLFTCCFNFRRVKPLEIEMYSKNDELIHAFYSFVLKLSPPAELFKILVYI